MEQFERRQKIAEYINERSKMKVGELARLLEVSEVTIRADLADLEAKGLLSRVHGGAVSSYKTYYNMDMQQRLAANRESKERIAEKVAEMIEDHDTVMLNSGTTTLTILRRIPAGLTLNIVTNSIAIALEAAGNPNYNVILLGGSVNARYQFVYGDTAAAQLKGYHADKLILSVDGISAESGFTTYYDKEAELDRLMLAGAATRIVAADSGKLGRTAFAHIAPLQAADYIVTNAGSAAEEDLAELQETVSRLITV
ncbi:MAG: DeoR/GlpR transcriptional regulator [Lachnospiraceae bacterium]|jgi:DeoR family fructose operon transcriptional repressor|nr:DeoR/GlpR transcriptional regulator [Lachnospiraceae bacterium]